MNPDVQIVLAYYSHYVMLPGYTPQSAMAAAFGRVASILPRRRGGIATAVRLAAQRGEGVARAIEALVQGGDPNATLRSTLGTYPPPAATVQVRFVFEINGQWRTRLINARWDESAQEVFQRAVEMVTEDSGPSALGGDPVWGVRGPTLLPSQQEQ